MQATAIRYLAYHAEGAEFLLAGFPEPWWGACRGLIRLLGSLEDMILLYHGRDDRATASYFLRLNLMEIRLNLPAVGDLQALPPVPARTTNASGRAVSEDWSPEVFRDYLRLAEALLPRRDEPSWSINFGMALHRMISGAAGVLKELLIEQQYLGRDLDPQLVRDYLNLLCQGIREMRAERDEFALSAYEGDAEMGASPYGRDRSDDAQMEFEDLVRQVQEMRIPQAPAWIRNTLEGVTKIGVSLQCLREGWEDPEETRGGDLFLRYFPQIEAGVRILHRGIPGKDQAETGELAPEAPTSIPGVSPDEVWDWYQEAIPGPLAMSQGNRVFRELVTRSMAIAIDTCRWGAGDLPEADFRAHLRQWIPQICALAPKVAGATELPDFQKSLHLWGALERAATN